MLIRRTLYLLLILTMLHFPAFSQELNCIVEVNAHRLQTTEQKIFETLESSIYEFMNNRKWTNDVFQNHERIECSIFINVTQELGTDNFKANVNIQSSRTAFNSDYNTVLLNLADNNWVFTYTEYLPLEFNENAYISNLTSMLAFYAYIIIGMDYDTYSLNGGTPYFLKAQTIVNNVPSGGNTESAPGWKPFEGNRNRYWLVENFLNPKYSPLREVFYEYHRKGLDVMFEQTNEGRQVILNSLKKVQSVAELEPNSMLVKSFFDAKSEELISIFSDAPPGEKTTALQLLYKSDPGNSSRYSTIMK